MVMVRIPRNWPAGTFHPTAAKRGTDKFAWLPGWQGTSAQPIQRAPIRAYTRRITSVPLSGGQVQGQIPAASATGSATSPSTFQILATVAIPAGATSVTWSVTLAGTVSSADANNFAVRVQGGATLAQSVNAGAAGTYAQTPIAVTGPVTLQLETWSSAPTAGSVYSGTAAAANGSLTLSDGPQGLGTIWYPVQCTASTTTGLTAAGDNSVCNIYLGPAVNPTTLVGTVYNGNGTAALAIPDMTPGQFLVFQWSGANPGDQAAANVIGTMDALGTG
jgi:hypothetical protein